MGGRDGGRRLLVVEDSLLVQRMMREFFESMGYRVTVAGNGREALKEFEGQQPEVIISDIIMPVMDGWEFCEKVRSDPSTADIPFLFVTSAREVPDRVRGLRMGADDYITKPFSREELLARVERILAKVERLRALEALGGSALSGHTSHLSVTDLFQLLGLNAKSGVVLLADPSGGSGEVHLREGRIVHAVLGPLQGRKALYRLLEWEECRFELDPLAEPQEESLDGEATGALMEALAHNDELRDLLGRLPELDQRYRRGEEAGRQALELDLEPPERDLLAEFAHGATLREVLDCTPLEDLAAARIVRKLLQHGLVAPDPS
jgi:CheY-like chemotaxis protein